VAYPALPAGGRPYDPDHEAAHWDAQRVWAFLARQHWRRRVDKVGHISLYNRAIPVGRPWAGTTVTVQCAVHDGVPTWVIRTDEGRTIASPPAPELAPERIMALDVSHRRLRSR
jgi:hypothetical protein